VAENTNPPSEAKQIKRINDGWEAQRLIGAREKGEEEQAKYGGRLGALILAAAVVFALGAIVWSSFRYLMNQIY
jgi:hypothetical protein